VQCSAVQCSAVHYGLIYGLDGPVSGLALKPARKGELILKHVYELRVTSYELRVTSYQL
jgi:hypothetical protein